MITLMNESVTSVQTNRWIPFHTMPNLDDKKWVADLSGKNGMQAKYDAYNRLASDLYIYVWNHLDHAIDQYSEMGSDLPPDLETFARETVRRGLMEFEKDNQRLLQEYGYEGSFGAWAAQQALSWLMDDGPPVD